MEKETEDGMKNIENTTEEKGKKSGGKKWRLPYWAMAVIIGVSAFLAGGLTVWFSLDKETRALISLKNLIQKAYYEEITDGQFYDAIFSAVNDGLLDPYSRYMTADEYKDAQSEKKGEKSGIGILFVTQNAQGEKQLYVQGVCGNSPAEEAGIEEGMYFVGFGKTETEIENSVDFTVFSDFLASLETEEFFYVRVQTSSGEKIIRLCKKEYVENYVFYRTKDTAYRFTGKDATEPTEGGRALACLDEDTAYIRLSQFTGNAAEQFAAAMKIFQTQGKKNLVLDLCANGGGYLSIMQDIASYFCKGAENRKPLVAVADYGEKTEKFKATGAKFEEYFSSDSKICVLADNGTASASECLIGCMLDYGATSYENIALMERSGVAKTYGKGIMQTTYPLLFNGAVRLTTARILWPISGNCIHGRGILPEDGAVKIEESSKEEELFSAMQCLF